MCFRVLKLLFRRSRFYIKRLDNKLVKLEKEINSLEESIDRPSLFGNYRKVSLLGERETLVKKYNTTYEKYIRCAHGDVDFSYDDF